MRTRLPAGLLVLALAAAGFGAWYWWTELRFRESTNNAYVRGDIATVSPRVAGYVRAVLVEDNQPVRAGDLLLRLDDRDVRARLAEAEAGLAARVAAAQGLTGQLTVQQARIREAGATLASAHAEANRARLDLGRYESLGARRNASQQQLDIARAEAERAGAGLAAAEAALEVAQQLIGVLQAQRATAEAERAVAAAVGELARLDLEHTELRAPLDGIVGNRSVQVGDYLRPGAQVLVVVPQGSLYVEANFKETQIEGMRVGAQVRLVLDAYPSRSLVGTVTSLAPASGATFSLLPPENATGNFTKVVQRVPVRIAFPNRHALLGLLRPGLSVVVTADTSEAGAGGLVPITAVQAAPEPAP